MVKLSALHRRAPGAVWMLLGFVASCAGQPRESRSGRGESSAVRQPRAVNDTGAVEERDAVFLLDLESRRAKFRGHAHDRKSVLLTIEGVRQLAWLGDDSGVDA